MKTAAKVTAAVIAAAISMSFTACGEKNFDYNKVLDENGYFKDVKASEIVTLPEYKGIDVNKSIVTVTEDAINDQVDGLLAENVQYEQITDRAVVDGDKLNIDYVGSVDGIEFEGGTTGGMGTVVEIGVTNYIDDFLYQLIGHMPGETVNVEVTFPENYGNEKLNGKDALFVTKINYICGEKLEAELNDEIAKNYGFDTAQALLEDIEKWIYNTSVSGFINELLGSAVCSKIPDSVLDFVIEAEMDYLDSYAMNYYGITGDQYILSAGYASRDAFIEANIDSYKSSANIYLAFQAIAEKEALTVTDEDITAAGITDADIEEMGKPYYKQYLLVTEIVPNFIIENANIVDDSTVTETVSDSDTTADTGDTQTDITADVTGDDTTAVDTTAVDTTADDTAA